MSGPRSKRARRQRRGAVLIVVLSMLVLFTLLAITYIIVANQYGRVAETTARVELVGDAPPRQLDMAMYQLLRGPHDPRSSVWSHDLLRDLYGEEAIGGQLTVNAQSAASGSLVRLSANFSRFLNHTNLPQWQSRLDDYYAGSVLTMLDGPAAGISVRVVRYRVDYVPPGSGAGAPPTPTLWVEPFVGDGGSAVVPASGNTFLINGKPLNGTGYGLEVTATGSALTQTFTVGGGNRPAALLPHYAAYRTNVLPATRGLPNGDADESYDAPDYHNMFLAMVPPAATSSGAIIPSFHRPELVHYWRMAPPISGNFDRNNLMHREILRAACLRPLPWDHPNFTGGNAALTLNANGSNLAAVLAALQNGPWDIDNDGDGVPDSVWVDLAFPIITGRDGRRYKPLFAFLVQDLDGRLNVNAHGNLLQVETQYTQTLSRNSYAGGALGASTPIVLPRGRGVGPAEISFLHLMNNNANLYRTLMQGRYGANPNSPGAVGLDAVAALDIIGLPENYQSATSTGYLSPPDQFGRDAVGMDLLGHGWFVHAGRPGTTPISFSERRERPYEINLVEPTRHDAPYTLVELERLLRWGDIDAAALPNRLASLGSAALGSSTDTQHAERRRMLTTHSYSLPVPPRPPIDQAVHAELSLTPSLPNATQQNFALGPNRSPTIADLLAQRLRQSNPSMPEADVRTHVRRMLPFEVLRGQKMDLNRLWGNGQDTNNNGVTDEGMDLTETTTSTIDFPTPYTDPVGDYVNGDDLLSSAYGRQLYARHLFCLLMLLRDQGHVFPFAERIAQGNTFDEHEHTVRKIAQWCINVVDFRDADGTISYFEYDVNPFNGWDVDGVITASDAPGGATDHPDRRVVWGCEFPDLLLTESLAFHDRRAKDLTEDSGDRKKRDESDPDEADDDLDQYRIPQGSLFLELYCPRPMRFVNPQAPRELYAGAPGNPQLDLERVSPPRSDLNKAYPVWQIVLSESHTGTNNSPLDWRNPDQFPDSAIFQPQTEFQPNDQIVGGSAPRSLPGERYLWFVDNIATLGFTDMADRIFYRRGGQRNFVEPGQYLVIGPRRKTHTGSVRMPTAGQDPSSAQYIQLNPAPLALGTGEQRLMVRDNTSTWQHPTFGASGEVRDPVVMIAGADRPQAAGWAIRAAAGGIPFIGVNISEPLPGANYYPEPLYSVDDVPADGQLYFADAYFNPAATPAPGDGRLAYPDKPLDSENGRPLTEDGLLATATTENYRTAFLQRLANPLKPWNPAPGEPNYNANLDVNPYITVDWLPLDLTVFNGEDRRPDDWDEAEYGQFDPDDPNDGELNDVYFRTRRRGRAPAAQPNAANLWAQEWTRPQGTDASPTATTRTSNTGGLQFGANLEVSLGFLNGTYGDYYRRTELSMPALIAQFYAGAPKQMGGQLLTFPWLTWNDRPFDNPLELLLVPAATQSRLLHEFSTDYANAANNAQLYYAASPNPPDQLAAAQGHFKHLLNFFSTSYESGGSPTPGANLYRLFDFVETPSPYVGAQRWYNPTHFTAGASDPNNDGERYRPPFNKLSRFRDPGKLNLNTMFDQRVLEGLLAAHNPPDVATAWSLLTHSRQGYPGTFDPNYPSRFAFPFRASSAGELQPLPGLRRAGVEATLLRSEDPNGGTRPLFDADISGANEYDDARRNPFFRYQGLMRAANLTTTQSNVYAVWITVGYFEVEPNPNGVDAAHPDGFRLGQELGADTGEIRRHRAFYTIDRSIPVAYQPSRVGDTSQPWSHLPAGENHNVDRAVLIRRFIE